MVEVLISVVISVVNLMVILVVKINYNLFSLRSVFGEKYSVWAG